MHADRSPSPVAATQNTSQIEWRGLEQVPPDERHGTPTRVGIMWFAAQLVPTAFFLGALGAQDYLGLNFSTAATAIVIGTLLGAAAPAVLGLSGPHTGLAQLAQAKSIFGRSIVFVGVLAAGTSVAFIALASIFGAQTLHIIFGVPFLPAIVTVFVLVGVVSVLGYRFMHLFENVMAVVVGAGFVGITIAMLHHRNEIGALNPAGGGNQQAGFLLMTAISFSFTFAWAHNAADYCRYLPVSVSKRRLFLCVFVGISCACIWLETSGLAAGSLMPDVSAMGSIHDLVGGGSVSALILSAMFLGVVANATVAQYSAGLQLLAAGVRLPRPVVTILTAGVALAVAIYLQAGNLAERFTNVMLLASYWVASFVGVAAIFWWRRRPEVSDLVSVAGLPIRELPWRPAAIGALVIGFVGCLPFSNTALGSDLATHGGVLAAVFGSVSRAWFGGTDLAYPAGILLSAASYATLQLVGQRRSGSRA